MLVFIVRKFYKYVHFFIAMLSQTLLNKVLECNTLITFVYQSMIERGVASKYIFCERGVATVLVSLGERGVFLLGIVFFIS